MAHLRVRLRPQLYFPLYLNGCGGCTRATQMCAVCAHGADADLGCLHRIFFRQSLTAPGTNQLVAPGGQWALDILLLPLQLWGYSYMWTCLVFTWVLEIILRSSCCAESTWPTETSPAVTFENFVFHFGNLVRKKPVLLVCNTLIIIQPFLNATLRTADWWAD